MKEHLEVEQALRLALSAARAVDSSVCSLYAGVAHDLAHDHTHEVQVRAWVSYEEVRRDATFSQSGSLAEALEALLVKIGDAKQAREAESRCVQCGAAGVATTGDGMMCAEHAIQWLRSEALEAADAVGPCGVKS